MAASFCLIVDGAITPVTNYLEELRVRYTPQGFELLILGKPENVLYKLGHVNGAHHRRDVVLMES